MIPLLAAVEPSTFIPYGIAAICAGGLAWLRLKGNTFWVPVEQYKKDMAAGEVSARLAEKLTHDLYKVELRRLDEADAALRQLLAKDREDTRRDIAELSKSVESQEASSRESIHKLRGDMNAGFLRLTDAITQGVLSLTKEVGVMQGRLAQKKPE